MRSLFSKKHARAVAPLGCLLLGACLNPPVETPKTTVTQETGVRVEQNVKNKVDVLFVIDDSPSMTPKQNELKARFPQLIKIFDDFAAKGNPAWYHIGVVTTDLGAGPFNLGQGQCAPGGKGGKLQAIGAAANINCGKLGNNLNFIDLNQLNNTNNLPAGQDLSATFECMASVGDKGCGFEQPLEAVYKALHDPVIENQGFLRDEAILAIIFVSDEDDCSVDANSDLFDPAKTGMYGALLSYRCVQFGYMCNGAPPPYAASPGELQACVPASPADGGKLIDVTKYVNFFTQPVAAGGVKRDPRDIVLAAITAPAAPVRSRLANPATSGPYTDCPGPVDGKSCAVVVDRSCISPTNASFVGDPAVRINAVVAASLNNAQTSICADSYQQALETIGEKIVSQIGAGCLTSPIADPKDPDCVVEDVTNNADGSTSRQTIQACAKNGNNPPCWALESNAKCEPVYNPRNGCMPEQFGVKIDRGPGGMAPPGTTATVACSTLAVKALNQADCVPQ